MIAVTFQHPTPYFDDSYAVNSANNGPYGDAILTELIPEVESRFRIIAEPYARVLTGGSTGGWESLALQVYHPDFFGGTWTFEVAESGSGSTLTITESGNISNPIFRFMSRFVFGYHATMNIYLEDLGSRFGELVEATPITD